MASYPAFLFYSNDWLTSTATLDADARGWLINLIAYMYNDGSIPNDFDQLCTLANVKPKELSRFKKVWKEQLLPRFQLNDQNRYTNEYVQKIDQKRSQRSNNRSLNGIIGNIIKHWKNIVDIEQYKNQLLHLLQKMDKKKLDFLLKNKAESEHFLHKFLEKKGVVLTTNTTQINNNDNSDQTPIISIKQPEKKLLNDNNNSEHERRDSDTLGVSLSVSHNKCDTHYIFENNIKNSTAPNQTFIGKIKSVFSEKFLTWYHEYGKDVDIEEAYHQWKFLTPEEHLQVMKHTYKFVQQTPVQYRPHPHRYLYKKRFNETIITEADQQEKETEELKRSIYDEFGLE